jgi:hypothetical protein
MLAHVMSIRGNKDKKKSRPFPIQATNHTKELEGVTSLSLDLGTRYS